jgi:hypothetical protein
MKICDNRYINGVGEATELRVFIVPNGREARHVLLEISIKNKKPEKIILFKTYYTFVIVTCRYAAVAAD